MVDYSEFDDDFKPEDPFAGSKAEDLTDGDYEFRIQDAKLKEIKSKGCVELKLEVLTPGKHEGAVINDLVWITSRDAAKRFGAILKRFGFDSDNWNKENGRSFSAEMPKSIRWLIGMRVKANKRTSVQEAKFKNDVQKTYHNINFKGRADGDDGVPREIGPEQLNQPDPAAEEDPFAAA